MSRCSIQSSTAPSMNHSQPRTAALERGRGSAAVRDAYQDPVCGLVAHSLDELAHLGHGTDAADQLVGGRAALDSAQVGVEAGRELLERRLVRVRLGRLGQFRRRLLERRREVGPLDGK